MKRFITLSLALIAIIFSAAALEQVLTGTVVDNNGKPLQGALVETPDGRYYTTTDFEGKYRLTVNGFQDKLTVRYVGYNPETQDIMRNMRFELVRTTWWNEIPKWQWFVGPQVLFPGAKIQGVAPGVMFGFVKKFGFYLKGYIRPEFRNTSGLANADTYAFNGKSFQKGYGAGAGFIARLNCPIYATLGMTYTNQSIYWGITNIEGNGWKEISAMKDYNIDLGIMIKFKHFLYNVNAMLPVNSYKGKEFLTNNDIHPKNLKTRFKLSVGFSYCF